MTRHEEAMRQFRELFNELANPKPKRPEAEVLLWPKPLSEMEMVRRQQIIDQTWERVLAERRESLLPLRRKQRPGSLVFK